MLEELKSHCFLVGKKQTMKAIEQKTIKKAFIAKDAEKDVVSFLEKYCNQNNIDIEYINTMKELGKACGIDVGAAMSVII
jgi:large subunit ribosomal protein L7A